MLTEAQKLERLKYITGSDAAVICGVNEFMTPLELYLIKRGEKKQPDISKIPSVIAGHYLEPGVAQMFENETGFSTIEKKETFYHPEYKWMAGHIDRFIVGENSILEIKTVRSRKNSGWGEIGDDTINDIALLQGAHYTALVGADVCYFGVFFRAEGDFQIYRYKRNAQLESVLIEKERRFWEEHVVVGVPPQAVTHSEVVSLRSNLFSGSMVATQQIYDLIHKYKELKKHGEVVEAELGSIKEKICDLMGDNDAIINESGDLLASWKFSKASKRFDSNRLRDENPELYNRYIYEGDPSRRFLVK